MVSHQPILRQRTLRCAVYSLLVLFIFSACSAFATPEPTPTPYAFNGTPLQSTAPTYNISGINNDGSDFQLAEERGKFVLLNFGYTSCPDICPLTLADLNQVVTKLGDKDASYGEQIAVVFVSVDPARDTPERLDAYMNAFNPDFNGIHIADEAELERVKGAFGIFSEKRPLSEDAAPDAENYLVDHTGGTYVIAPDGNVVLYLRNDISSDDMVSDLEHLMQS